MIPTPADVTSFHALANSTAFHLARESLVNVELREALQTVRLGKNAVRVGNWDIIAHDHNSVRSFSIRSKTTGRVAASNLAYYETARAIVSKLNAGISDSAGVIRRLLNCNEEFIRVRSDVLEYEARADSYYEQGEGDRAALIENRLSDAQRRLEILREHLLSHSQYI